MYKCLSARRNWDSPNASPASEFAPTGHTRRGDGGVPIRTSGEKAYTFISRQ